VAECGVASHGSAVVISVRMRLPSKANTFVILMVVSAVLVLLPREWTNAVRGLFQPLALLQYLLNSASQKVEHKAEGLVEPKITQEEAQRLLRENQSLQRLLVDQQGLADTLARQVAELSNLRDQWPDSHARVILAPVIAFDADPRRESMSIALDERSGPLMRPKLWVVAGLHETPTRALLGERWLVGQISDVQPRVARVQLVTDPGFSVAVQFGILTEKGWALADEQCYLQGRGNGKMLADMVTRDYYAAGYRMAVVPPDANLPLRLSLGRIESSRVNPQSSKWYDLTVVPWAPARSLTHVYVLVTPTP